MTIDVHGLLAAAELLDVTTFELGATRVRAANGDEPGPVEPRHEVDCETREDGGAMRVLVSTSFDVENVGSINSVQAIEYAFDGVDLHEVEIQVIEDFVNNVALMAVLPFVREAVAEITRRVFGASLLMPIVPRGAIEVTLSRVDDEDGAGD